MICVFNYLIFFDFMFQFRLKQSGLENLMYIVEGVDKKSRFSIPLSSLLQAAVNCLVQDGFTVKYTRNHKDSMSYLSCVTKTLIKIYKVCKHYKIEYRCSFYVSRNLRNYIIFSRNYIIDILL